MPYRTTNPILAKKASDTSTMRKMPFIEQGLPAPTRPISFVCVKYSNEFEYNILQSDCIHDPLNQFIVVENEAHTQYQTLGQAINDGIDQAEHEIIVVVHEDILFLPGWQSLFEKSVGDLEKEVPDWMLLGVIGWDRTEMVGSCGDPRGVYNADWRGSYTIAPNIDEQLLVFRKSSSLRPDPNLPSIHNYGKDLIQQVHQNDCLSYVVRAPTVHKYADEYGNLTLKIEDSSKIQNRKNAIYKLHKACSDEYLAHKWPKRFGGPNEALTDYELSDKQHTTLEKPLILLGQRDALKAHLSTYLPVEEFIDVNSIDSIHKDYLTLRSAIIKAIFRKFQCPCTEQKLISLDELKYAAKNYLEGNAWPEKWGFAIEESAYVLEELQAVFPFANYIHVQDEDAINTSSHWSFDYLNNELGRTLLLPAYQHAERSTTELSNDSDSIKSDILSTYRDAMIEQFIKHKPENLP